MTKVITILRSGAFEDHVFLLSMLLLTVQFPYFQCYRRSAKRLAFRQFFCSFFEQFRKDLEVSTRKSSSLLYRDSLASLFWGYFIEYGLEENLIDRVVRHVERLLMKLHNIGVPRLVWPGLKAILPNAVNSWGSRMLPPTYYLLEYPKDLY